ncbi:MAG: xanthine dehydrogenase family protein molybdopterin-binding subunit [bacterium]|nr:xanthine dehydrogenase family protein molybdopterin-binding subunit [bacterium]
MAIVRFGAPFRRIEDGRFLTGRGRYVADIDAARQLHMVVLRSPHAHARIASLDTAAARMAPEVVDVVCRDELRADGLRGMPTIGTVISTDGRPQVRPHYPILAGDRVRFVGQPVAAVVAETVEQAADASELIEVDFEPLPAAPGAEAALGPEGPQLHDEAPSNLCFDWETGDRDAVERAFAGAAATVEIEIVNNRMAPAPIEPRGAVGEYDAASRRMTLTACHQGVHFLLDDLAHVLGIAPARLRILTPDIGGGFGMKYTPYPEQALVLWLARRTGRPVRWISSRSEAFISDAQARDHRTRIALALDGEGRFLALRSDTVADLGAYLTQHATRIPTSGATITLPGPYLLPEVHARVRGAFSNSVPVDAMRGAGQPEGTYARERVIEAAARRLGVPGDELRRRNLVPREAARAEGMLLGRALVHYLEATGRGEVGDTIRLRVEPSGHVTLVVGSISNGQGHETAYAQMLSAELGVAPGEVRVVSGDSDVVAAGSGGSSSSHFLQVAGPGLQVVAERVRDKLRRVASHLLEAAEADIEFKVDEQRLCVAGTDRSVTFREAARAAHDAASLPADIEPGLDETAYYRQKGAAYPTGCHVCEIAVDPDTGMATIRRYVVVDDFGNVLNPLLVEGQVHGGLAQGIGQALLEHYAYDPESGQPMTGSLLDYTLPRADDLPAWDVTLEGVPNSNNAMGVKGCGEAGTIAAPPAVINALLDALAERGVTAIDMAATPQRIWRALQDAALREERT